MTSPVLICGAQFILYALLCLNFRAVAQADYGMAVASDAFIASANFYLFRSIAKEPDSTPLFIGYVLGSILGSVAGIRLSVYLSA